MKTTFKFASILSILVFLTNFTLSGNAGIVPQTPEADLVTCNLPAPDALTATRMTASSVNLSWSAVSGASAYKLTVYEMDGGTPVYLTESVVSGLSKTQSGVPSGEAYRFTVASICSVNSVSDFIICSDINP